MGTTLSRRCLGCCHWLSSAHPTPWRREDPALLSWGPSHPTCNDAASPALNSWQRAQLPAHPPTRHLPQPARLDSLSQPQEGEQPPSQAARASP